jgi:hypothetical protein
MSEVKIHYAFVIGGTGSLVFIDTTIFTIFGSKQTGPSPSPLHNLHRQAIYACFTERTKTKREAEKVLFLQILNVNSAPLDFI